jgi:hypothetical protein
LTDGAATAYALEALRISAGTKPSDKKMMLDGSGTDENM